MTEYLGTEKSEQIYRDFKEKGYIDDNDKNRLFLLSNGLNTPYPPI